jgi:hypothetical protein
VALVVGEYKQIVAVVVFAEKQRIVAAVRPVVVGPVPVIEPIVEAIVVVVEVLEVVAVVVVAVVVVVVVVAAAVAVAVDFEH